MITLKKSATFWSALLLAGFLLSCTKSTSPEAAQALQNIIPKPVSVTATGKMFTLTDASNVYVEGESEELANIGRYLTTKLNPATGFNLEVSATKGAPAAGNIYLALGGDAQLGEEGYLLTVTEELVKLTANKPAGIFFGVQTLRQMFSAKIESATKQEGPWEIATAEIRDLPRYEYRGSMLDVARHFFGVEDVKRYIDLMSYYKMNVIHLGLTNDQGWRIEIKSWPNLAIHGGSTQVGGGKGGYYTQEQYKDLVAFAASRYMTLVPEIDLPGHTNAALASYGELNSGIMVPKEGRIELDQPIQSLGKDKPTELYTGMHVGFSTLSLKKESTFKFVTDVLHELAEMTPGPYLHVGGDEAHVTKKDDYITFVNRFTEIVKAQGKIMVGWEEIAQGNIGPEVVSQFWTSPKYALLAVQKGSKLIMSPSKKCYMDMQYDSTSRLGLHWAAYIEVDSAYTWDPETYVKGISRENILGVEAPLWSETIKTMDDIEYLAFPRIPGYAEIGWSPSENRGWEEYKVRLGSHGPRLKAMEVDYYASKRVPWKE